MASNAEEWERVKAPRYLQENLIALAEFIGAKVNDVAFIESIIRGSIQLFILLCKFLLWDYVTFAQPIADLIKFVFTINEGF